MALLNVRHVLLGHTICLNQFPGHAGTHAERAARRAEVTAPAPLCEKLPSRFRAPHTATTSFATNGLSALIILKPQRYNRATTRSRRSRRRRRGGGQGKEAACLGQHEHLAEMPKRKCPKHASQAQLLLLPLSPFQELHVERAAGSGVAFAFAVVVACGFVIQVSRGVRWHRQLVAITVISAWRAVHAVKRANTHTDTDTATHTHTHSWRGF